MPGGHEFNGSYAGDNLNWVAFPMGGIGAGMVCIEGTGAFSHVSVRHRPDVFNEPLMFAALHLEGDPSFTRVLEGPVPRRKAFGAAGSGLGGVGKTCGLPRFGEAVFTARFPFASIDLAHPRSPVAASVTGWSPFIPGSADDSSLPLGVLEYRIENTTNKPLKGVFSFHAENFMATAAGGGRVDACEDGFVLRQPRSIESPVDEGAFAVAAMDASPVVDCRWFRGHKLDTLTVLWKTLASGAAPASAPFGEEDPSPGGSVYIPFAIAAGQVKNFALLLAWYVPASELRCGMEEEDASCQENACCGGAAAAKPMYTAWYTARFDGIEAVLDYARQHLDRLRTATRQFSDCFYDTTLPPEVVEAVAANLTILKSPTVLRQADGRLWAWEGCCDTRGCCSGSCTHVWNYAQALPHLFPDLERSLRETEFNENQHENGHQDFRAPLPIRPNLLRKLSAADGQLGGIMKVYRDWRISGNTDWLRTLWPKVKQSMDYCIETWDPDRKGAVTEPHHNTYDIEFWGPDGMCTSFYLGALAAAVRMAEAVGEDADAYRSLAEKARTFIEGELFDGEYFIQKIEWKGLRAGHPADFANSLTRSYSNEALEILKREGPRHQYGDGCLSDGVLGAWIARVCGLADIMDADKIRSHLLSVYRYNLRRNLSDHANAQRSKYAFGCDGGLVLCTWPKTQKLSLPFIYSDEVWTGIEYQVASHLMMMGCVREGLEMVRIARARYDGRVRNPFNEYECGHWYARAMSSFGLIQGLVGTRYDAVEKVLHVAPRIEGDFRSFLCTATGYATVGVSNGRPFIEVRKGRIEVKRIDFRSAG